MSLLSALFKTNQFQGVDAIDTAEFRSGVQGVTIKKSHLAAFCDLVGWSDSQQLPPTYLQMLANKYVQHILTQPRFPFSPLGVVHIANEIKVLADVDLNIPIDIRCQLQPFQQHYKGVSFSVVIDVWQGQKHAFQADCNMLCIDKTIAKSGRKPSQEYVASEGAICSELDFSSNIGRRYAKVSGDYNPIHLTAVTAKLLGFKRAIAHGMYSQALCLSKLSPNGILERCSTIKVGFKQPLFLPSTAYLDFVREQDKQVNFTLISNGKVNLQGQVLPA